MPDLKLTYFDFHGGRGEPSRLALHRAGVAFEDDRLQGPKWPALKPHTPYGGLPVLRVEGRGELAQSNAVLTYIGRTTGQHPADPFEAARHESVMCAVEDARAELATTGHADPERKRTAREEVARGYLPEWGARVAAQVRGPYIGGAELQVADLKLYVFLRFLSSGGLDHVPSDVLDHIEPLVALREAVGADAGVQSWYATARVGA